MDKKPNTFMGAMKHFFGFKKDQILSQFSEEVKALNDDERKFFRDELNKQRYEIS